MSPRAFGLTLLVALPAALTLTPGGGSGTAAQGSAGALPLLSGPREAHAAVSIQLSLDELVSFTSYVVVATATEQRSQWEEIGGARRIVTYTRLTVDRAVAGQPDADVWVRTLGGVVGDVGQQVSGDAHIKLGTQAMLFLTRAGSAVVVSGMAQGHYPVVDGAEPRGLTGGPRVAVRRLAPSPDSGTLLPRPGPSISAREQLVGATLDAAIDLVGRAWKAKHAQQ
ncbi:hypothetical protein SOCEGT47_039800 [Sorangium cellulosum]|uniref:Secreted protein n=1 Tax=Sorangium cellulosum TaxID=56 RepID=A0A4P2Q2D4_SORCE|nr:hypothetical protein [Sorangium cellulosum]AUX23455.1 hypothetical protein SOCEGT47_039800 [Sorangium cellulosum]